MNKKLFKKFQVKDKAARTELARAHGIIVLLAGALIFMLMFTAAIDADFNPVLTVTASVLLGFVALLSLSVILSVLTQRRS